MVPLNLAGVFMDPVEQGQLEVLGVVVSESPGGSPLRKSQTTGALSVYFLLKRALFSTIGGHP